MSHSLQLEHPAAEATSASYGPITRARLRRTTLIYLALAVLGALPTLMGAAPTWQAAGLGLWFPGAGFLAVGDWALLLVPIAFGLFAVAVFVWFATGAVLLPPLVWLGSSAVAGWMSSQGVTPYAWPAAWVLMAAGTAYQLWRLRRQKRIRLARRAARVAFLPKATATLDTHLQARPSEGSREIPEEHLPALRYALDRALQPIPEFGGFDRIDQFQPAAWRYQLNHFGIGLSSVQAHYTPNFHGYLSTAQTNLIEKYLDPRVWRYWVLESIWGHLNVSNFDPAARDNIMLTGWLGLHIAQYMQVTGDRRYAEPGSLTFRLNARTEYRHDIHSIIRSVIDNLDQQAFCLYPCEPNWIYPICNHYALAGLAGYDALFNTGHVDRVRDRWFHMLDTEFTDESGAMVGLRSSLTGFRFPFPSGEAGFTDFTNVFAPQRARRMWAIARTEIAGTIRPGREGKPRINLPGLGIDFGNYRRNHSLAYAVISCSAGEMGDMEILEATQQAIAEDCRPELKGGVKRYMGSSNMANVRMMRGALARRDDFARSLLLPPSESVRTGPLLAQATYPEVLVAKARSEDGASLDLVLHPGAGRGEQTLGFERLQAGRRYTLQGMDAGKGAGAAVTCTLLADAAGKARVAVQLDGRTVLRLQPEALA
jgi:hypothetical protein